MYCQFSPDSEPKCAYVGEIANKWGYARRQRQKKMVEEDGIFGAFFKSHFFCYFLCTSLLLFFLGPTSTATSMLKPLLRMANVNFLSLTLVNDPGCVSRLDCLF